MPLHTIGHSDHTIDHFLNLISGTHINAIVDVRSSPYSKRASHFTRENLESTLESYGISYAFLGNELGGRPSDKRYYENGIVNYEAMAHSTEFLRGIKKILRVTKKYKIALMCSEREPLDCHRFLLISRYLSTLDHEVFHILASGQVESHPQTEQRLLELEGKLKGDFFAPFSERLAFAYRERARKVAYSIEAKSQRQKIAG